MKIVTWNCQGAFRKKAQGIAQYMPDLAIIQECECPEKLTFPEGVLRPVSHLWFGHTPFKGLSVNSYTDLSFSLYEGYDPAIRYCIPLNVTGHIDLNLIAVWAMPHEESKLGYIGQVHQAIVRYGEFIQQKDTIIIGGFNSNKIWDRTPRIGNHSFVVKQLADLKIVSVYHEYCSGEDQGKESMNTLYMYRKREKGYHIDYCFVPKTWIPHLKSFSVGAYEQWIALSDHTPVFAEFYR